MTPIKIASAIFVTLTLTALVWASEADELREKAYAMRREAAELAERGYGQEAENLEREALAILQKAEHPERRRPNSREAEIGELEERLERLRAQERELEEIGGEEERLNHVRREAEQVERQLYEILHEGHHAQRDDHDELVRRLEHMQVAAENLRHAGLHDIAEHVAERAEAVERELHERDRRHDEEPIRMIMNQLEEIQHELGRLRNEVNELKEGR